jgi:hypothetical protein
VDDKFSLYDFALGSMGMVLIALIILLGSGLGFLFGLPYAVTGLLVGIVASWAIISGSLAGTLNVQCPECGNRQKVVGNVDSYQCSGCGHTVTIKKKEKEVTLYSAFPTD